MSKPVLHVFVASVWATAPQLAMHELGYDNNQIVKQEVDLAEGANFHPEFLKLNPKGTLPTLVTSDRVYTSTKDIVRYLIDNAPRHAGKLQETDLIEKLHAPAIDPNFSMFSSRSDEELDTKASGIAGVFVRGRQATLERLVVTAPEHKAFYNEKLAQNGFVASVIDGTAPPAARQGFITQSQVHWKNVSRFISTDLPSYLPDSGFIGGDTPSEEDFHLAVWLARTVAVLGGSPDAGGIKVLEGELGGTGSVPSKVESYWKLWSSRDSWKTQYGSSLH